MAIERILKAAVDRGASDVHIKADDVVRARIDGRLSALTKQALSAEQTRSIAVRLLGADAGKLDIESLRDHDCSWSAAGVGRFRVNILRQRASFSIVCRVIPEQVPTVQSLKLPEVLTRIAHTERGMVLVTGVTGSGKSSTMAALVHEINRSYDKHILTLENPIEFLHADVRSSVTQREVGVDTESFRHGLRAALRQDPDVILIGEMRDAETIDTAMKAAETGHLLISTLHTPDAQSTIVRIMAMFPPEAQPAVRMRLAESLHAVVSQRLLPHKSGKGRVLAAEVMIVTSTIRDLILDGRVGEIHDYIAEGQPYGMQTFDQHLTALVQADEVSFEVAKAAATNPGDFELHFNMGKPGRNSLASRVADERGHAAPAGARGAATAAGGATAAPPARESGVLGTGPTLPPIGTNPLSQAPVRSPDPFGNFESPFESSFDSLFGNT